MTSTAYALDDPTVTRLGKFLARTPLSNGQFAPIPDPLCHLVAQAVANFSLGLAWDNDRSEWIAIGDWESTPDLGEVQVDTVADQVTRITHRTTVMSALGESPEDAWSQLRRKVRAAEHG